MKHLFIAALAAMITVFPALAENIDTDQEETKVEKTEKKKKNVTAKAVQIKKKKLTKLLRNQHQPLIMGTQNYLRAYKKHSKVNLI